MVFSGDILYIENIEYHQSYHLTSLNHYIQCGTISVITSINGTIGMRTTLTFLSFDSKDTRRTSLLKEQTIFSFSKQIQLAGNYCDCDIYCRVVILVEGGL